MNVVLVVNNMWNEQRTFPVRCCEQVDNDVLNDSISLQPSSTLRI